MANLESEIQIGIMSWVKENEEEYEVLKTIYHTPNSFFGTNFGVIAWLKKLGMRKGIWDICIPIDNGVYPYCYLEIKSKNGKLSKEQLEFRQLVWAYSEKQPLMVEIKTVEDGIYLIRNYLNLDEE